MSKYLQLPRAVRLPAVKLTSFLNFFFKTAGESGRQKQFSIRLSSCILDMCEIARKYGKKQSDIDYTTSKVFKNAGTVCYWNKSSLNYIFFSEKNICDKIDFHIARQTW